MKLQLGQKVSVKRSHSDNTGVIRQIITTRTQTVGKPPTTETTYVVRHDSGLAFKYPSIDVCAAELRENGGNL